MVLIYTKLHWSKQIKYIIHTGDWTMDIRDWRHFRIVKFLKVMIKTKLIETKQINSYWVTEYRGNDMAFNNKPVTFPNQSLVYIHPLSFLLFLHRSVHTPIVLFSCCFYILSVCAPIVLFACFYIFSVHTPIVLFSCCFGGSCEATCIYN